MDKQQANPPETDSRSVDSSEYDSLDSPQTDSNSPVIVIDDDTISASDSTVSESSFFSTNSNTSSDSEHEVEARVPSTRKFIEKKLSEKEIESIETIKITEEQIKKNLEFSVCLEDYKLRENVNKLSCSHLFHNKCVIPWLKLHGTCPVCRESLTEGKRHRFRVHENF
ncbi:hypothetical protein QYM36_008525 [Artemia franciscana]|uniref:RING-type E3 ubiquitin transferase n=1 Tax=Artemia franciscana TaxID=6661 RepID=A0AA88IGX9_ARTSF|nr:hypothetical protein QYM36_008525 [Artemia franciscana]